ncbi:MAG: MarR family winged helix-turn-helix transcriptional regulator [Dehalococcoidia bacterium]
MTTKPPSASVNGWRLFITAHAALIERIDRELSAAGVIPLQWYDVLVELAQAPERRRRMYELADAVVLSKSSLSRLIDRLEAEGLLRREPAPNDRRGAFAVLTDAGQEALEAAWPIYAQGIEMHFARHFSDEETAVLIAGFRRILAALRTEKGKR